MSLREQRVKQEKFVRLFVSSFFWPVELVNVLDVSKQSAHLLRMNRQIGLIDDVGQVVLEGGGEGGREGDNIIQYNLIKKIKYNIT